MMRQMRLQMEPVSSSPSSSPQTLTQRAKTKLSEVFGLSSFRPNQEEVVSAVLAGLFGEIPSDIACFSQDAIFGIQQIFFFHPSLFLTPPTQERMCFV